MLLHHCQFKHFSHERIIKKMTSFALCYPVLSTFISPFWTHGPMGPIHGPRGENAEAKWPGADLLFRLDQLLLPRLSGPGDGGKPE